MGGGPRAGAGGIVAFGLSDLRARRKAEAGRSPGAAVTVHYDPNDPARSTLDTASHEALALARTGWVCVGVAVFIYGLMARVREQVADRCHESAMSFVAIAVAMTANRARDKQNLLGANRAGCFAPRPDGG
jgi:uncharacterized protein DUF3592